MKAFIILCILMTSNVSLAQNHRKNYIMTPRGPVRVLTPADMKRIQEQEKKQLDGVGMELYSKAEINKEENRVMAFIRGCGKVDLGPLEVAEEADTEQKDQSKKLKTLKNGDPIVVRMEAYGACAIKDWRKR